MLIPHWPSTNTAFLHISQSLYPLIRMIEVSDLSHYSSPSWLTHLTFTASSIFGMIVIVQIYTLLNLLQKPVLERYVVPGIGRYIKYR